MFGLTFLEPMFLLGLLAAPLPVLIHLFQRRRARVVPWSTLEFVRPLEHPRRRRVDPRRFLLLAVRVAALVLLALSLARPTFTGGAAAAGPADAVIILDASLSMGSRAGSATGETLFEAARGKAGRILDLLDKGDRAALVVAGGTESENRAPAALGEERAPVRAGLGEARVSSGRLAWADALARAERIFAATRGMNRELFLVSDFQASGWEEDVSLAAKALAADKVRVIPVRAGPLPAENLSLDELRVEPLAGGARVSALVRNQGSRDVDGVAVELDCEGGETATAVTSVAAGQSSWAVLEVKASGAEALRGRVSLPVDACPADNTRWFAAGRPAATRVLLVGQPSPASPGELTTHYLKRLLAPPAPNDEAAGAGAGAEGAAAPGARNTAFEVTETNSGELTSDAVGAADVIVLADCDALSAGAVDAIRRSVAAGHGLFIFVGPGTDIGFMNRVLLPGLMKVELAAAPVPDSAGFGWGATDRHHPIFGVFPESPAEAFARVRFTSCLAATPGKGVRLVASFADGRPALMETDAGEGRVLLFTSSADLSWGNLPLSGNFLPFMHEAALYLAGGGKRAPSEYLVGQPARRALPAGAPDEALLLRAPEGATTPLVASVAGGGASVATAPLSRPGLYSIERGGEAVDWFAVNADPRESVMRALDGGAIAARLAPLATGPAADEPGGEIIGGRFGRELRPAFLWAVLLLLMAEILIRGSFALREESAAA